jgi:hypothetical protein
MSRPSRPAVAAALVAALACATAACHRHGATRLSIDLLAELPHAERHAAHPLDAAIHPDLVDVDGRLQPALVTWAPVRIVWPIHFTERAELRGRVALLPPSDPNREDGVVVHIGITDGRLFDWLWQQTLRPPAPGTQTTSHPIAIDLSPYSGWHWSLFYRPDQIAWRLYLTADLAPGGTVAWAGLRIEGRHDGRGPGT